MLEPLRTDYRANLSLARVRPPAKLQEMSNMSIRSCRRTHLGLVLFATPLFTAFFFLAAAEACTNILVSRGASADGSVFVSFSVDGTGAGQLSLSFPEIKKEGDEEDPYDFGCCV